MAKKAIVSPIKAVSSLYCVEDLELIFKHPHILGHIAGYTKLKELHSEWVHYLFLKDGSKVRALFCHRGSYKSTTIAVAIVWRWLFFPEDTIMLLRKDFNASVQASGEIATIMRQPEIRELFKFAHGEYPECLVEQVGSAILDYSFRKKPSMSKSFRGVGSGSNITGLHYNIVVIDDLSNLQSRISRAERLKDVSVYREVTANVQNRGDEETGFTRVIGTPWVDPSKGECLEAIIPEPKRYYLEDTNLISNIELDEIRRTTTHQLFNCNYLMQFVSSDSAVFIDPTFGKWDYLKCETPRAHVDFGFSKEGDATALTIGASLPNGMVQMVGFLFNGNGLEWIERIVEIMKSYRCRKVWVEDNRDAGWGCAKLRDAGVHAVAYHEGTNKNVKIASYGLELWHKVIWAEETDPQYLANLLDWQDLAGNTQDDAPDSYASLVRASFSKRNSRASRWEL